MNSLICVSFGAMAGLIVGLLIIIKRKNDEILGLKFTIGGLESRVKRLGADLSHEKRHSAFLELLYSGRKVKFDIKELKTEELGASGWYFDGTPEEIIKKELAYKIADHIVDNNLLKYYPTLQTNKCDSRLYHTAYVEIVKRG